MTEFKSGQTAVVAVNALKSSLKAMISAEKCSVLWFGEIMDRQLYRELGHSSINQFAKLELGFSTSRTGVYKELCSRLKELPKMNGEIESGELGYTKAQAIIKVADKDNEQEWLDLAKKHSRRELEKLAKRAKEEAKKEAADRAAGQPTLMPLPKTTPKAVLPVYVNFKMSPTQYARYEAIWERVRKQRHVSADKVEALLEIMESFAVGGLYGEVEHADHADQTDHADQPNHLDFHDPQDHPDHRDHPVETEESTPENKGNSSRRRELPVPNKPPVQIHIHQCPDCAKATVQTCKGELEISKTDLEQALCDCQISKLNERNTRSIPPATRRLVLAKARHQCQQPGCNHTGYLEVHHIIKRSNGGTNVVSNLKVLCSACHRLLHEKDSTGMGQLVKETPAVYQWKSAPSNGANYQ